MKLDGMNAKQLRELKSRIDEAIIAKQASERHALRQKFAEMASEAGLSIGEIIGQNGAKKLRPGKASTQYRDAKTGVIWGGRGRYPRDFSKARAEAMS